MLRIFYLLYKYIVHVIYRQTDSGVPGRELYIVYILNIIHILHMLFIACKNTLYYNRYIIIVIYYNRSSGGILAHCACSDREKGRFHRELRLRAEIVCVCVCVCACVCARASPLEDVRTDGPADVCVCVRVCVCVCVCV